MCILRADSIHNRSVVMLIQLLEDPGVQTLAQLKQHTLDMVSSAGQHWQRTIVLGPMTPKDGVTVNENMEALRRQSEQLSKDGWIVLELTSFQFVIDRLISSLELVPGEYPWPILHEFTVPLIQSGWFPRLHFRSNFQDSIGAKHEHEKAYDAGLQIYYFD